jgi:CheY-like chemotaxis protein
MVGGDYSGARILIVDDEEANVLLLERMLTRAGYTRLAATQDSRQVLQLVEETRPDLILLDLSCRTWMATPSCRFCKTHLLETYLPSLC